jgi:hypothetical protein
MEFNKKFLIKNIMRSLEKIFLKLLFKKNKLEKNQKIFKNKYIIATLVESSVL